MKSYEAKLYTHLGKYKKTIPLKLVTTDFGFSEELNGGQGDLTIEVVDKPENYSINDIIEIREVDDTNKKVTPTYTGIIEEFTIGEFLYNSTVTIQLLGVFTALNDVFYKNNGAVKFTATGTVGNIVQGIINSFNADYGTLKGDTQNLQTNLIRTQIDNSGANISLDFEYTNCFDAIKKAVENTEFSFFIGADGILRLFKTGKEVRLTMGRQVHSINRRVHKTDMVNRLYLTGKGTVANFTDQTSIDNYGKKEKSESIDSNDQNTLNKKGTQRLSDLSNPQNNITVNLSPQQSTILPGDMLYINNTRFPIENKKITKISKSQDSWTIEVGDFISFGNIIKNA